eukprot:m.226567 g.226567  ORF g.226567 m.226567 type:complete len:1779 (+) comp17312_c0_seq1:269-5605(+)
MFKLLALTCLVGASFASKSDDRISVSPSSSELTPIVVREGFKQLFTFKLKQPIACPADNAECHVIVALTNSHPDQINVDNCHVKWAAHEWHQPRYITVSAKEDFVDDKELTFRLVTETATSASAFYHETDVADIVLKTTPRPSANCHATGDPHYRTFDGHPYHIRPAGKAVFYKSADPERFFEVQTDMYVFNGRPAVQCGVAARENNDIIVVNLCRTGSQIDMRRTCGSAACKAANGFPKLGVTSSGLPRYTINFASGAQVRIDVNYWSAIRRRYMNVYVTAPGVDSKRTTGLCGNNDGVKTNDVNVGHNGWINNLNLLAASQRVTAANDLFSWYPAAGSVAPVPTLPPFAEECNYTLAPYVRPILNQPNVENIADLIKDNLPDEVDTAGGLTFTLDDDVVLPDKMPEAQARIICLRIKDTAVAKACLVKFPTMDVDAFVADCIEDVVETADPTFLEIAVAGLEDECADLGNRDLDTWETDNNGNALEPSNDLQGVICPTANDKPCSGNGVCNKTLCTCNAGFKGLDCAIDTSAPVVIESMARAFCDGRGLKGCDPQVSVFGRNIFRQGDKQVLCKFGDLAPTNGFILGSIEMLCELPTTRFTGQSAITANLTVSVDGGTTYTAPQLGLHYTWYDSVCEVCNATGCAPNPDSCNIGGQCHLATEFNEDNQCLQCTPATSTSAWSYSYVHALACGPRFDATYYEATIVARAAKGEALITMDATNALTQGDPTATVTYSLSEPTKHPLFTIHPTTGMVTTTAEIVVTESLQLSWKGTMLIKASDGKGNFAETNLHVDVVETNSDPIFTAKNINVTLKEDDAVGSQVAQLKAEDSGAEAVLTYAWLQLQSGHPDTFALNTTTGVVTLAKPLDFETQSMYTMQVAATDNAGQFDSATLRVIVTDVNEAPTNIALSANSVPEANAAAVVGVLTVADQDTNDAHTLTVKNGAPFAVSADGTLSTTTSFDYETTKTTQVTVVATDRLGLSIEKFFDLVIADVNEAPTSIALADTVFAEDVANVGNELTVVTVTDPDEDDTVLCTLRDDDNGHFVIEDMRLVLLKVLDFETTTAHSIDVWCEDKSGLGLSKQFDLTVTNADEAPKAVALTQLGPISEDAAIGTQVGTISAIDEDTDAGDITFSVEAPGDETAYFTIGTVTCGSTVPKTCTAPVLVAAQLDYDISGSAPLVVRAVDNQGLASLTEIDVTLANVNEVPKGLVWAEGSASVEERAAPNTLVGQLLVDDEDKNSEYTFTLRNAATSRFKLVTNNNRRRAITGSVVNVVVRDSSALNAQTAPSLILEVDVQDGSTTSTFSATVSVVDAPLTLTFDTGFQAASVLENAAADTVIGTLTVGNLNSDETLTGYRIVSGAGLVEDVKLVGDELRVAVPLDFERTTGVTVTVEAIIQGGRGSITNSLAVDVEGVDEAPVFMDADGSFPAPTAVTMNSSASAGALISSLIARDPEGEIVTLSLSKDESEALSVLADAAVGQGGHRIYLNGQLLEGDYRLRVTATTSKGQVAHHEMMLSVVNSGKSTDGKSTDGAASKASSNNAGATAGIIVGVLVAIVLIAVVAFIVVRRRRNDGASRLPTSDTFKADQVFDNPTFTAPGQDFVVGVNNPMYEWYAPDLSRADATNELAHCAPGAFVVRDSQATPGWHILGVKTGDAVLHEKICMDAEGLYELIPSNRQPQPAFHSLPDLVHYYGQQRDGMSYSLDFSSFDNPLYAAFQDQQQSTTNYATADQWLRDVDAPLVPLKARDLDTVAQLQGQDDIYTNAAEANAALSTTA